MKLLNVNKKGLKFLISKKQKKAGKKIKQARDLVLEDHIVKLIEELEKKQKTKQTIDSVVKKSKKTAIKTKKSKDKKIKEKEQDFYNNRLSYGNLEKASIYSQIIINPFVGFMYKSNIKENKEFYSHLMRTEITVTDALGEKNLASSEMMDNYARKTTLNFLMGAPLFGIGGVNDISVEERELMNFNMYDRTQKEIYLAKVALIGFGREKTMHAPTMDKEAA